MNKMHRADKMIPRVKGYSEEQIKEWCTKVAALKCGMSTKEEKTISTDQAILALFNSKEIPFLVPTNTMNRWLNWYGFSFRQIRNYSKSTGKRLFTTAPNKWWFMDFSVSEVFYLANKNGRIVNDNSGLLSDKNHREERLTEKGYSKLLIGVVVDLFSSAYWANAYVCPGESSLFVIRFLMDAMLAKADPRMIFRGIPENIYCDSGPGNLAGATQEMLSQIGVKLWTHFPGNAKAKGRVESRIGRYKNDIERILGFEKVETIERYREITQQAILEDNISKGKLEVWSEIFKMPGALREFDDTMRNRLGYSSIERKVNRYGCVSIDNIEYFVARKLSGEWVNVFTLFDGSMKAIDRYGIHYPLSGIEHQYQEMTGKAPREARTEYDEQITQIEKTSKQLKETIRSEHFLKEIPGSIVPFNRQGEQTRIETAVDVKLIATADEAWTRLWFDCRISRKDLRPDLSATIDKFLGTAIRDNGGITPEQIHQVGEIATDSIREVQVL
jgi:transposase InsO family protein